MPVPILAPPPTATEVVALPPAVSEAAWDRKILVWTPGKLTCTGGTVKPVRLEAPAPTAVSWLDSPVQFSFKVDALGRPFGIVPELADKEMARAYSHLSTELDLEPSLAGSMFSPGRGVRSCRIEYSSRVVAFSEASYGEKVEWAIGPEGPQSTEELNTLFLGDKTTCNGRVTPRVIHFAPYDELPTTLGHAGKAMFQFDIDSQGVPQNLVMRHSTLGPKASDAAMQAITNSRFAPKAHTGCLWAQAQGPNEVLLPPPNVEPANYILADARCPRPGSSVVHVTDVPFPPGFQRRNILGWAIVRFDVSPEGKIKNASAPVAEPAAAFGVQAVRVIEAAHADPTSEGWKGCVSRIYFSLSDDEPEGVFINKQ